MASSTCDNTDDPIATMSCGPVSHQVTTGTSTTITTQTSFGLKVGVKAKNKFNIIFDETEIELSVETRSVHTFLHFDSTLLSSDHTCTILLLALQLDLDRYQCSNGLPNCI